MRSECKRMFLPRLWIAGLIVTALTATPFVALAQEQAALTPRESSPASHTPTTRALVSDEDLASLVEDRIERWQPIERERSMDQIGWAKDIRHALRLAHEHDRPVFLFTHRGRINVGRC